MHKITIEITTDDKMFNTLKPQEETYWMEERLPHIRYFAHSIVKNIVSVEVDIFQMDES